MKTVYKFLPVIFVALLFLVQANQNGYSASGFNIVDSVYGNAKDSLIEPSDSLLAVQEKLTEGRMLYAKKCQKCHELHSPKDYKLDMWKENLDEMKDKAELTKGEYKLILGYLAANCKK